MNQSIGPNPASVRLLIIDDQPRARQSLKALLTAMRWSTPCRTERPIEVIGEAENGQQVVEPGQAPQPDVVLMALPTRSASSPDPQPDGLEAIRSIKRRWPAVRIVVLTLYATDRSAALLAGADAFLLKGCSTGELLEAMMPGACTRAAIA